MELPWQSKIKPRLAPGPCCLLLPCTCWPRLSWTNAAASSPTHSGLCILFSRLQPEQWLRNESLTLSPSWEDSTVVASLCNQLCPQPTFPASSHTELPIPEFSWSWSSPAPPCVSQPQSSLFNEASLDWPLGSDLLLQPYIVRALVTAAIKKDDHFSHWSIMETGSCLFSILYRQCLAYCKH